MAGIRRNLSYMIRSGKTNEDEKSFKGFCTWMNKIADIMSVDPNKYGEIADAYMVGEFITEDLDLAEELLENDEYAEIV